MGSDNVFLLILVRAVAVPVGRCWGTTIVDRYFHYSFPRIKKLIFQKLMGAPKNQPFWEQLVVTAMQKIYAEIKD